MTLAYDGQRMDAFGVRISGEGVFNTPSRDIEFLSVPGRNGDLSIDNGRYNNISITYPAFIKDGFPQKNRALVSFLASVKGYKRLEDDYNPDYYRMAVYQGGIDFATTPWNRGAKFDLVFNCKPQKYLKVGEQTVTITTSGVLFNPTRFNAKPLIKTGKGTITIGDYTITVANDCPVNEIYLDCDLMNAYNGTTNLNNYVSGTFPELIPGANAITGNFEIQPRWWTI